MIHYRLYGAWNDNVGQFLRSKLKNDTWRIRNFFWDVDVYNICTSKNLYIVQIQWWLTACLVSSVASNPPGESCLNASPWSENIPTAQCRIKKTYPAAGWGTWQFRDSWDSDLDPKSDLGPTRSRSSGSKGWREVAWDWIVMATYL